MTIHDAISIPGIFRITRRPPDKARMDAPEIRILPGYVLMKVLAEPLMISIPEDNGSSMHPFPAGSVPGLDSVEIIEFCHASARGCQMTLRPTFPDVDPANIQDASENAPVLVKLARLEAFFHPCKTFGIVDLIAVEPKDPGMGSGIILDEVMADGGCHDAVNLDFVTEFGFQLFKNFKRAVRGGALHRNHLIAEIDGVSQNPFDIQVLILY